MSAENHHGSPAIPTSVTELYAPIAPPASTYQLTAEERSLIDNWIATAKVLEQQAQGALSMLCKIRGLEGNWNYDNGRLTKQGEVK